MEFRDNEEDKVARLTAKQRQCMDLVVLRKSSKQIARELGISKPTVDQRIANARAVLGASNRDEAALIYARHSQIYDRVICDSTRVPTPSENWDWSPQDRLSDSSVLLQEPAAPFSGVTEHHFPAGRSFLRSPSRDFNSAERILIITGLTVGILAIVLVGLAVAQSISGLLAAP